MRDDEPIEFWLAIAIAAAVVAGVVATIEPALTAVGLLVAVAAAGEARASAARDRDRAVRRARRYRSGS